MPTVNLQYILHIGIKIRDTSKTSKTVVIMAILSPQINYWMEDTRTRQLRLVNDFNFHPRYLFMLSSHQLGVNFRTFQTFSRNQPS